MGQIKESRVLLGGIDTDSAPNLIDQSALLNSVNVRTVVSSSQNAGNAQFIPGNLERDSLKDSLPAGNNILIGKVSDSAREAIFYFFYNDQGEHTIIAYNVTSHLSSVYLRSSYINGGLPWNANTRIDARVTPDLLFWVANGIEPGYLNFNYNYASVAPFNLGLVTLIVEPPIVPLQCSRVTNTPAYGDIQLIPLQFTYRITTLDGFTSVLAPYSLTALPVRQSELNSNPNTGNSVDITVNLAQKFPPNWKTIELVVRYVTGNTFDVIKQYNSNVIADRIIIDNHNSGIAAVNYVWLGGIIFALDPAYFGKQFDNVPLESQHLEIAANRLFLANNIEGYTGSNIAPDYSITTSTYTTSYPTSTNTQACALVVEDANNNSYYAIIVRLSGVNYLLPKEFNTIGFFRDSISTTVQKVYKSGSTAADYVFQYFDNLPLYIHKDYLIRLNETGDPELNITGDSGSNPPINPSAVGYRVSIVNEANGTNIVAATNFDVFNWAFQLVDITNDPAEFGASSKSRLFYPLSTYRVGIDYYDNALRKCGAQYLTSISIPYYGVIGKTLTELINFTLTNSIASVPAFAEHFALIVSRNQVSNRIINFVPGLIRVAVKSGTGEFKYGGWSFIAAPPTGYNLFGIAIPLGSIAQYGYGYTFNEGDSLDIAGQLSGADNIIKSRIRAVQDGYVIAYTVQSANYEEIIGDSDDTIFLNVGAGTISCFSPDHNRRQGRVLVTIRNGESSDSLFEIAKFGKVTNNQYAFFYDTNTLSTTVYGDGYTQKRIAPGGAMTGVSITTYDLINQFAVNDTGRIAETDRIGQKRLPTIIRFSNTNIPGTNANGYGSFEALDYKIIEETAGSITYLALTTKAIQEGGQMVILCSNNSFVTLVGKQQVYGSDQNSAFVISSVSQVLGDINPLKGNWTCESPRTVAVWEGKVWWVDVRKRKVIEFGDGGANAVSKNKANRQWQTILSQIVDPYTLTAGINPYCSEYLISVPELAQTKNLLTTTALEDPFNAYYSDNRTYIYNWEGNIWCGSWEHGGEFMNVGNQVFGWKNRTLYEEFIGDPGVYCGETFNAIISIPFNEKYPLVKSPEAIRADCNMLPIQCFVYAFAEQFGEQVAQCADFSYREGDMMAQVLRNRLSENANTSQDWDNSGAEGDTLKGKVIQAAFIFAPGEFYMSSASLVYRASSGH